MKYYNDNGSIINKDDRINDWYIELSRWIKKHLIHTKINKNNIIYKEYISTSLLNLVNNGYKLLG